MMAKKGAVILIVAAIVCGVVGFVVGQVVQAAFNSPGSENDPLVSQSYVETIVGERTAALQTQIEELQNQLNLLQGGPATTTTSSDNTDKNNSNNDSNNKSEDIDSNTQSDKTVTVTGNSVNVRSQPNTSASIVSSVAKGDKLTYISKEGDWYKVKMSNGSEGWIASWLATVN
ncbi:MAG: SH3 domain-containing protein [Bacillota bacterium]|jgi:uncharacterized protein YgiM (DUF1202 family)